MLLALVLALVATAFAVHNDGVFELDGNATNDAAPGADWADVFNDVIVSPGGTTSGAAAQSFITRDTEATAFDQTYWKGGGSKDVRDISAAGVTSTFWEHSTTDSAPDTDDIQDAFAAAYNVNNHLSLYFGMDRFDTNGSSQVGFWFFKSPHAVNPDGTFSGVHDVGDLLVLSDFTTGGKIATVKSFKWVGSGGDTGGTLQSGPTGVDCQDAPASDVTCARVNSAPVASPWTYIPKGASSDSDIPTGGLFEGGINVNEALGASGDICFSQFLAETRSSGSAETAQLKDFATGRFDLCDVRVRIAPDDVNEVGQPHTFTVTVEKKSGGTGFVAAPDGHVDVTLTPASGATPNVDAAASTCDDAGDNLDANGQCTIKFTSPTAGTVTGHAKATVTLAGEQFVRETTGQNGNSGDAVKRFVDANIAIAPDDTNEVGQPHTFTVTVRKNAGDGNGFVPATVGDVDFALTDQNGAGNVVDAAASTCDDAGSDNLDANGQCTIVFTSPTAGKVIGNASVVLTIDGVTLTRDTDPATANVGAGPGGSGPAAKVFVDARIRIAPDDTNEVGQPHTFTVTVDKNAGDGNGFVDTTVGHVDVTLASQNGASHVINTTDSTCDDAGDNLDDNGQCTLVFTSNSAGTVVGNASVELVVGGLTLVRDTDPVSSTTAGPGGSGPATKVFVDANIAIAPDDTNEVGQSHTFTVTVKKNAGDGNGFVAAAGDVDFTLADHNGAQSVVNTTDSTCDDPGNNLDANGQCTIVFTSSTAGTVTGNASVQLVVGGVTLTRDSDPATGNVGSGLGGSGPATKRFVNARISIAPDQTNEVGQAHTFTVTVEKNFGDGNGFVAAAEGDVDFSLTDHNGANSVVNGAASTCDDAGTDNLDANGQCTIVFTSDSAGTVVGNASVTLDVGGVTLTRDTDPTTATVPGPGGSGSATKVFVDARITIAPDQTNDVGQAHTFTVSVEKNAGDGNGFVAATVGDVDFSLVDHDGANSVLDAAASTCDDPGNSLNASGQCTIVFTSDSAGSVVGNASVTLVVGGVTLNRDSDPATATVPAGPGGSGPATKVFVDARITIAPDQTNEVGQPHTFTVTVDKNEGVGDGFVDATVGHVDVTLVNENGASHVINTADSTCDDTGDNLDDNGQCTLVFTSNSAGTVVGIAAVTLEVGGVTLLRDTDPVSSTTAGPGGSGPATKVFVDANIAIAPDDTNGIGEAHTFTVTVNKNEGHGDGFVAATVGHVDVTLANQGGASAVVDAAASTCDDAGDNLDANGKCTLVFASDSAGTVVGNASVELVVGGLTLVRDTDPVTSTTSGPGGGSPATKIFVDGTLLWRKVDQHGNPLAGATFRVCRTHRLNSAPTPDEFVDEDPDVCFVVQDNQGRDVDPADGKFKVIGLVLGKYTVEETIAPPGYARDDTIKEATLDLSNLPASATFNLGDFVNEQLFRLIVVTCNESVGELVDSEVTLGTTTDSITDVPAHLASKGVTQQDLCDIGGAAYGSLDAGTYAPSVELPDVAPLHP